jgi:hypothetical protein
MKRGPKDSRRNGSGKDEDGAKLVKSTFLIDQNMKKHLAIAAIVGGVDQADIVREAIRRHLVGMGSDPTRPPALPEYDFS